MLVATDGEFEAPVKVYHWWPGKEWRYGNPIPSFIIKEVKKRGSRYLTYVETFTPTSYVIWDHAACCPRDMPSRKMGRKIALGRLSKRLMAWHNLEVKER